MSKTPIEWVRNADGTQGQSWNPVRGCSRVSEGCRNCYGERMAARFSGPHEDFCGSRECGGCPTGEETSCALRPKSYPYMGFATMSSSGPRWTGRVELIESKLEEPLHWKKPRMVFVNSMSDLFHLALSLTEKERVFRVMLSASQHFYQILTKRAGIMAEQVPIIMNRIFGPHWRMPDHIWLGVSVEDQATADERIPLLLQMPATVHFVSYEPALGPVDFRRWLPLYRCSGCGEPTCDCEEPRRKFGDGLDGLIAGGESGPGARPAHLDWFRSARDQCQAAGVSFFMKQITERGRKIPFDQWPEDLRIRELPEGRA